MHSWLVKQEPETTLGKNSSRKKKTIWEGVHNYQARNFMRQMAKDDLVLFCHSGKAKELVRLAKVAKPAYPDPTAAEGDWSAFDLQAIKVLAQTVSLKKIKADPELQSMHLVRNSRLSVMPVDAKEFKRLLDLAQTSL
ncbi:MAG: EVE domain-containing protein [Opitutales bacterium]|nr:EVE domain-containing protein [Opitutales bacterium]